MDNREIVTVCHNCDAEIKHADEHVGIITCLARYFDHILDVDDAVQFKTFCAICSTAMDYRFLFPKPKEECQERITEIMATRVSRRSLEEAEKYYASFEGYGGVGKCELCWEVIRAGEQFRTIEAERNVIGAAGTELQESLTVRCYCKPCSELFDFEEIPIYRIGHDPNFDPKSAYRPQDGFGGGRNCERN